mmetsp:Transcript_41362/g.74564  ORF Transcript_41362/g.74564 Transcript_41362/m.74564 type:complete len:178 (-) Transcript_41362:221-754(-)|eukprot:CAMPEP_0201877532 /NCGR_PEP_ID=MMETSP0902-20130614/8925_1 /ASSEMBLY_ACC=CAM_ASM_000551 /TAXON_ID=420261 /ORGANISM="Thalassiosira antarctica, Strain CCMP982" /LENGTH=177 /DNA_ID=CAMNT_0048404995 /DNA_START=84 /DNA_END=617 /DNA_ORIENTATION=-
MVDPTPLIPGGNSSNVKQGHQIFGCCCDSKRAVIVFNIITLVCTAISMIWLAIASGTFDLVSDDVTMEEIEQYYIRAMIFGGVTIGINVMVIFGASIYNAWAVLIGALWVVTSLVLTIMFNVQYANDHGTSVYYSPIVDIIWAVIVLYPHIVFIYEVRKGIMTPQTYSREEYSCCCV